MENRLDSRNGRGDITLVDAPLDRLRLLAGVIESSDDAILTKNLDGTITSWNAAAARLYGYAAEEVVGKNVSMLAPPELAEEVNWLLARLSRGERVEQHETLRRTKDGRIIEVSLTISPLLGDSGAVVGASTIARDIGERRAQERQWRLLSEMGQALSGELQAEQVLRELARRLVPEVADYCITYLLEGSRIQRVGAAHADPGQEQLVNQLVGLKPPALDDEYGAGAVVRTGESYLAPVVDAAMLEQVATAPEYLSVLRRLQPISSMVLPLRARGRTVGAVAVASTPLSGRHYTAADLALAQEFASRAALALDNARLYQEAQAQLRLREDAEEALRRQYEQLRVLYDLTHAVSRASALEEIYDEALDALRRTLDIRRASILLFDPDGVMRFKAWRSLSDGYRSAVEGHTPWTPDAVDPQPIVIGSVESSPDLEPALRRTILGEGIRAIAFIPLTFGARLLGKFMLYRDHEHAFGEEELELAKTVAGTVAFAITRVHDAQSVRQAKEEAERANEAKSQFLGVMSHELRTPLNAIGGYVELLDLGVHGPATVKQKEAFSRIAANQRHLLGLINDILSFARLEAGQVEYHVAPFSVRLALEHLEAIVTPLANAKGVEYRAAECDPDLCMLGDEERVNQILLNLVGNGIKFTPEGGKVSVAVDRNDEWVSISVRDNGPGIAPEHQERIFDPFVQVDRRLHERRDGAGLGLAISRELARGMGGDLDMTSKVGKGSVFTLRLPVSDTTVGANSRD